MELTDLAYAMIELHKNELIMLTKNGNADGFDAIADIEDLIHALIKENEELGDSLEAVNMELEYCNYRDRD